ncbi:hypothetical protein [Streptomyces sp. NPDC001269]
MLRRGGTPTKICTGSGPESMAVGHTDVTAGLREMSLRPFERPLTLLGLS